MSKKWRGGSTMTLHQMRIFAAIAKRRSVTKAANELHISQPAMTRQMNMLQDELGVLFHRTPQGIGLTVKGRLLLRRFQMVLDQVDEIQVKFGRVRRRDRRAPLSIGGSNGPAAWFLPSIVARFRQRHGDAELE